MREREGGGEGGRERVRVMGRGKERGTIKYIHQRLLSGGGDM